MIPIAIIGYGYWGRNLTRNFFASDLCRVISIADSDPKHAQEAAKMYPSVELVNDYQTVLADVRVDAVVIATPVNTHFRISKDALLAGKHVLVEKPMAFSVAEALELGELCTTKGLVLMTDHTFLYTGAVRKMKNLVQSGVLGKFMYYDSTRINLGLFQSDVNVVWDLAPHDLAILFHLTEERPISVSASGIAHLGNGIENIAYVTLYFQSNLIAHFTCSWSSPVKIRKILVGGDRRMMLYDDMEVTEKVKVYDSGFSTSPRNETEELMMRVDYRVGDIQVPKLDSREALAGVVEDFMRSILDGREPISGWLSGLDVVRVLEAAQLSIKQNGREIRIARD